MALSAKTWKFFAYTRTIEYQEAKAICDSLGVDWPSLSRPAVTARPWHVPGTVTGTLAQIRLGAAGTPGTSFEEVVGRRVIRSRGSDGVAYTFQEFLDWCDNDFDRARYLWSWAEPADASRSSGAKAAKRGDGSAPRGAVAGLFFPRNMFDSAAA